jgi:actin-related protein 8
MGFASQDVPFNVPHCIARHKSDAGKLSVRDQVMQIQGLFSPVLGPVVALECLN